MPLFEIKHRWTGSILFSLEIGSFRLAVEAAVKSEADLRGANLRAADLRGANLREADLREADLQVPIVPDLDTHILTAIDAGGILEMGSWHQCQTMHCRAGWAIHLAGKPGYALEKQVGSNVAGALIYQASAGYVPNFYATHDAAYADILAHAAATAQKKHEVRLWQSQVLLGLLREAPVAEGEPSHAD